MRLRSGLRMDRAGQAWLRGRRLPLRPKARLLLAVLHERAGEIVDHRTLQHAVWGHDHVEPQALFQLISEVRAATGDRESITTYPNRGYAWTGPVHGADAREVAKDLARSLVRAISERLPRSAREFTPEADHDAPGRAPFLAPIVPPLVAPLMASATVGVLTAALFVSLAPDRPAPGAQGLGAEHPAPLAVSLAGAGPAERPGALPGGLPGALGAFERGMVDREAGRTAAAIRSLRLAVREYPRFGLAKLELARTLAAVGAIDEALTHAHDGLSDARIAEDAYLAASASLLLSRLSWEAGDRGSAARLGAAAGTIAEREGFRCVAAESDAWNRRLAAALEGDEFDPTTVAHQQLAACRAAHEAGADDAPAATPKA